MTSAYILVTAILILGGVIASLGDRLGSKVGKARLRLFNLRPRQTAVLVTVITGTLISASTLVILFTLSESLRQGVFEFDDIQQKRREVQRELDRVLAEKENIETELKGAEREKDQTYKRLNKVRSEFKLAKTQLKKFSDQAKTLIRDVGFLVKEKQQLLDQRNQLEQQSRELRIRLEQQNIILEQQNVILKQKNVILEQKETSILNLEKEQKQLQTEIGKRDSLITQLDQAIAHKDRNIEIRTSRLQVLESQLEILRKEVAVLEDYYQTYQELRERKIALLKGQVLAFGVIRILEPSAVKEAINRLLREANRKAIESTIPNNPQLNERVVQISEAQVQQLSKQLQDGREYVVRIISAGNYVQGEKSVVVFADLALNQVIYQGGDIIANISMDTNNFSAKGIQEKLDLLIAASQFRIRRSGVLGDIQVADGKITTLVEFIQKLSQSSSSFDELRTVVLQKTYTSGPINLELQAVKDGEVVFSTSNYLSNKE